MLLYKAIAYTKGDQKKMIMCAKLIYVEKTLLDQAKDLAEADRRFFSGGRPSSTKVICEALRIFFAMNAQLREQMLDSISFSAPSDAQK